MILYSAFRQANSKGVPLSVSFMMSASSLTI